MSDPTSPEEPGEVSAEAPAEVPSEVALAASAEGRAYLDAMDRCQQLLNEGRADEALAELNRLPAPSTEEGRKAWPVVELMKRIPRAVLHSLSGDEQEALAEWRAIRAAVPPASRFDGLRKQANSWILVQERGPLNVTEEEYQSLVPSVQMVVNQQRALMPGARALDSAQQALMRGDQAEYENQMAAAARAVDLAAAENPSAKPMLQAAFGMNELVALTMAQQRDFDRFDFDRVSDGVARIEARSKQVASSEATIKQFLPLAWIPGMASTVTSLAQATERLSQLLRTLLSGGPAAKHLEELSRLKAGIQEQQQILRELKAPAIADRWRMLLLGVADKLLERTERLGVEVRPSRQTLVNLAGLAATISFVTVAALLLAVGRLTGTELNGGVVLALSAFFGLVGGFGYGALRFQGFLTSVLFGQGRKGDE